MWHGKMTDELEKLYDEYFDKFRKEPDCYEGMDYGQKQYKMYVRDIKKALRTGEELPIVAD